MSDTVCETQTFPQALSLAVAQGVWHHEGVLLTTGWAPQAGLWLRAVFLPASSDNLLSLSSPHLWFSSEFRERKDSTVPEPPRPIPGRANPARGGLSFFSTPSPLQLWLWCAVLKIWVHSRDNGATWASPSPWTFPPSFQPLPDYGGP